MMMEPKSARTAVLVLLLGLLLGAGCQAGPTCGGPGQTAAQTLSEVALSYVALSRADLAGRLAVPGGQIALSCVHEPDAPERPYVVQLAFDGRIYEYHGRNGEVLLISEPLVLAATAAAETAVPDAPPGAAPRTEADLVRTLEAAGALVALNSEPVAAPDMFAIPGQAINVNGAALNVYVYDSVEAAATDAARVSPSGYGIDPPPGAAAQGPTILEFGGPPHFFQWENLILLYVGQDANLLRLLESVAGPQFAGEAG